MKRTYPNRIFVSLVLTMVLFTSCISVSQTNALAFSANLDTVPAESAHTPIESKHPIKTREWIVKWKAGIRPTDDFLNQVDQLKVSKDQQTMLVRLHPDIVISDWAEQWKNDRRIVYIQPNYTYHVLAKPNDTDYLKQDYLRQIEAEKGWDTVTGNKDIVIALVDTGVDLNHPDLKGNLIPGKNLLDPSKPPQDDNGHGTNVAGIIAAVGDNAKGVSGLLWSAKIMPVKVLDKEGTGNDFVLGEGIKYAVDKGAKVVALSLGFPYYGPHMEEVVDYAEKKGVIVIAASGNEGERVSYPAAYPSVIAVGAVNRKNQHVVYSNHGPEIDVVAPGQDIFTTALGGGYMYNSGTSMAAPQVAALAGLILAKYPSMKPGQVRNLLRQTAKDVETPGWDELTGYGLIQVGEALTATPLDDIFEPNDTIQQATPITFNNAINAQITAINDIDRYYVDAPYPGTLTLSLVSDRSLPAGLELNYTEAGQNKSVTYIANPSKTIQMNLPKGRSYLRIGRSPNESDLAPINYTLTTKFKIYKDLYEDNDQKYQAYVLSPRNQMITGTFDKDKDQDWFLINFPQKGKLTVKVTPDSLRMDPTLQIQKDGDTKPLTIDQAGLGQPEGITLDVDAGKFYIHLSDYSSYAVQGEYTLKIQFETIYSDANEPNNQFEQSTALTIGKETAGVFTKDDEDWFHFKVTQDSLITFWMTEVPDPAKVQMTVLDSRKKTIVNKTTGSGGDLLFTQRLAPGTYKIKLKSSAAFTKQQYRMLVGAEPLVAGYKDIANHWAKKQIVDLTYRGWIQGYSDYSFRPNQPITRAEVVAVLVRAYHATKWRSPSFRDVEYRSWAYEEIGKAYGEGWISGYPDGLFHPDAPISRAEMAAMVARVRHLSGKSGTSSPFRDVAGDYWALPMIREITAKKWISGYPDGTFHPLSSASRAEFITLLSKVH